MNPTGMLREGSKILDRVLRPHGFTFVEGPSGSGSGGHFAAGNYVRGDRRLELHFRHSLGLVTYHIGALSASHEAYMRDLLGREGGNRYPGFSDDPLDGFRHLAHDLERFAADFLSGSGATLKAAAARETAIQESAQKTLMAASTGETVKRQEARRLFREGDYEGVVELLEGLSYPELMTESEKKILDVSKKKVGKA
jgi:hypothetical protein